MAIPRVGQRRFQPFEPKLRKKLTTELESKARVRRLFKRIEHPAKRFSNLRDKSAVTDGDDLMLGRVDGDVKNVVFVRRTSAATDFGAVEKDGAAFVAGTLQAEDRELIDALAANKPFDVEVRRGRWNPLLAPGPAGGSPNDLEGRVFLALSPDDLDDEFLREHSVTRSVVAEPVVEWARQHHQRTIGFLVPPDSDRVKMIVEREHDWDLAYDGDGADVRLAMLATWRLEIKPSAVVRVLGAPRQRRPRLRVRS